MAVSAASGSWSNSAATGDWTTGPWTGGTPGVSGTAGGNTDIATFGNIGVAGHTVTDAVTNREIGGITLNGSGSASNYTIGSAGNTLYLNAAGAITDSGTNTSTIASNINFTGATESISTTATTGSNLILSGTLGNSSGAASTLTVATGNAGNILTLAGPIQDGTAKLSLTRGTGFGTLLLQGANTFSGGYLSSGSSSIVTQIGVNSVGSLSGSTSTVTSGAFGTGLLSLNGGSITSDGTTARMIYNAVELRGGTNILGDGTNNGTLTFNGAITTNSSASIIQANSTVIFANPTTTSGTSETLTLTGSGNGIINGVLGTNITGVTKNGAGTWTLAGATGASTGNNTVNDGSLKIGANNVFGTAGGLVVNELNGSSTATVDLNGFNLQTAGLNLGGTSASATGSDQVINTSGGASTLTTANIAYSATNNPLGAVISVNNLNLGSSARSISVQDSTNATADLTISSNIQGSGGFNKSSLGLLLLTGTVSNTGNVGILDGTLQIGANNVLLTTGTLFVSEFTGTGKATFDLNGFNQQVNTLQIGSTLFPGMISTPSVNQVINSSGASSTLTVNAVTFIATNNPLGGGISVNTLDLNAGAAVPFTVGDSTNAPIDLTISSVIQNGGMTKSGLGALYLNGANTYTGNTTLSQGALIVGGSSSVVGSALVSGPLGTGTLSSANGAILEDNGTNVTLANSIHVAGTLTLGSTGSGSLIFDGTGLSTPATFVLTQNAGLAVNNTTTINDVISGAFNFTKSGAGTLALAGANTYTGTTTIENGALAVGVNAPSGGAGALGNATSAIALGDAVSLASAFTPMLLVSAPGVTVARNVTIGSASGTNNSTYTMGGTNTNGTATYTGNITMNQAVTLQAATGGTVDFTSAWTTNNNPFTIGSTGNNGIVQIDHAFTTAGGVTVNNGALALNNALTGNMTVATGATLGGSGSVSGTTNVTGGAVSGSGLVLGGLTTFNGTGNSLGGTVTASGGMTLASGASVTESGTQTGAVSLTSGATSLTGTGTVGAVTLNGGGNVLGSTGTLATGGISVHGTNNTISSGTVTGAVSLSGASSLQVNGAITSSATVGSGQALSGSGTVGGAVAVQSGGKLASGATQTTAQTSIGGAGVDTITGTGLTLSSNLTVAGGSTLSFYLGAGANTGALNFANPNKNSTYLVANGLANFDAIVANGKVNINLIDLTAFSSSDTLPLREQNPYLLISTSAADNSDFNLYTTGGYDQNGEVLGIGVSLASLNTFNITTTDVNGNPLVAPPASLRLYLYNGQLEVVPEPGAWAMMLVGLATLTFWPRRRKN